MTLSETIQRVQTRMDTEQLKVPIGFIRVVELIFALIVYVSLNSWDFDLKYTCNYAKRNSLTKTFSLENLNLQNFQISKCDNSTAPFFPDYNGGGADFFSYLVVLTIFYSLGALLVYLFWWSVYVSDDRLPHIDLAITTVLAFSWLIGTFRFSSMLGQVIDSTEPKNVQKLLKSANYCAGAIKCEAKSYAMYSSLTIATIAGVGCILLYAANIWFVYKETANYRARSLQNIQVQQQDPYTLE